MTKRLLFGFALALALATSVAAQITVPNTLVDGTTITAGPLNTNFTTIANHALDRLVGGNISGTVTVDPGITIDGIDIGATVCVACAPTFKDLTLASPATGLTVAGNVIVNALGKIPAISSTYFSLLDMDASNLTSGTVPTAQLGSGSATSGTYLRGDSTWAAAPVPTPLSKTANYNAVANDMVAAPSGTFTVTLPAASANAGAIIRVVNNGTGTITIGRTGSDTVGLATSQTLNPGTVSSQGDSMVFISDGTSNWGIF